MTIFERVRAMGFPEGQYVVIGSGIMAAKGIRDAGDLDFVATPELFEKCKQNGWELKPWTKKEVPGYPWLKIEGAEMVTSMSFDGRDLSLADLIKESELIEGIYFLNLRRLVAFKKEWGRPKDFVDIALIEEYLQKTKQ